jgi:hypothetical protein
MNVTAQPMMSTPLLRLFAVFWWLGFFGSIAVIGSLVDEWRSIDMRAYGFFYQLEHPFPPPPPGTTWGLVFPPGPLLEVTPAQLEASRRSAEAADAYFEAENAIQRRVDAIQLYLWLCALR